MSEIRDKIEGKLDPAKFQSPMPFLIRLKNLIFGKERPDVYTRVTFYVSFVITIIFLLWNLLGYVSIASADYIQEVKGISVDKILEGRGMELGFFPTTFAGKLMTVYGLGAICWAIVIVGLVLLWRKNKKFLLFTLIPIGFFVGMEIFYLNFQYFVEDTTLFDKMALLILAGLCIVHAFMMKNEREGGSISFFGED